MKVPVAKLARSLASAAQEASERECAGFGDSIQVFADAVHAALPVRYAATH